MKVRIRRVLRHNGLVGLFLWSLITIGAAVTYNVTVFNDDLASTLLVTDSPSHRTESRSSRSFSFPQNEAGPIPSPLSPNEIMMDDKINSAEAIYLGLQEADLNSFSSKPNSNSNLNENDRLDDIPNSANSNLYEKYAYVPQAQPDYSQSEYVNQAAEVYAEQYAQQNAAEYGDLSHVHNGHYVPQYYKGAVYQDQQQFPTAADPYQDVTNYIQTHSQNQGDLQPFTEGNSHPLLGDKSTQHLAGGILIFATVVYLLLGAAYLNGGVGGHEQSKDCPQDASLWFINPGSANIGTNHHGASDLQKNMLDMFYDLEDSDSSESNGPDMSNINRMCGSNSFYYGMNSNHMMAVETLKNIFMEQPGPEKVYQMAKSLRHSNDLNPRVWYEAIMKACHERPDMKGMIMPGPLDAMPDSFIPSDSYYNALGRSDRSERKLKFDYYGYDGYGKPRPTSDKARSRSKKKKQKCARIDGSTGEDNGIENRLWYWREDLMLNANHWYWHMNYPTMAKVHGDRRGELFSYLHHGIVQRYNIERMCSGMDRVDALPVYPGAPLLPPYNPHLDDTNSGMKRTERPPHTLLADLNHEANHEMPQTILLPRWLDTGRRFATDVSSGYLISRNGKKVYLSHHDGIDIVGNTLEASDLSINPEAYSPIGFHNEGHVLIGLSVDPNYKYKLPPGPMADTATAMRDPIFYTFHTNVDNLVESYKKTLKPHQPIGGEYPLLWNGIHISDVRVHSADHAGQDELRTFWNERKFELAAGLAFDRNASNSGGHKKFPVCLKHLDHEEFAYHFDVERRPCANTHSGLATARIFIAPHLNEHGKRLLFIEQRKLFVPLDSFKIELKTGRNVVKRQSVDSTLTIPWRRSLAQLQAEFGTNPEPSCGCGWPHHLLLPRGNTRGKVFDLFIMVTNGEEDAIKEIPPPKPYGYGPPAGDQEEHEVCRSAHIYCGVQGKKYPDARPMGYPFDRYPYQVPSSHSIWDKFSNLFGHGFRQVSTIEEYVHGIPNMAVIQIKIRHDDH